MKMQKVSDNSKSVEIEPDSVEEHSSFLHVFFHENLRD
jgi:hypothetical protein